MTGFVLWNQERIGEFSKAHPDAMVLGQLYYHPAYDAWLTAWVDEHTPAEPKRARSSR